MTTDTPLIAAGSFIFILLTLIFFLIAGTAHASDSPFERIKHSLPQREAGWKIIEADEPFRQRDGSQEISIQITDVEPRGMQFLHSHKEEQCYYVISGTGLMIIDDCAKEVTEGDAVFIPSNSKHGIKNIGNDMLTYLTANRAFGKLREREIWPQEGS